MREIDVPISADAQLDNAETVIERCCAADGLRLTLKGTLARYPGSVHWHYQRDQERGTLEVTFWSEQRRIWFKISAGRQGDWMDETIARASKQIQAELEAS